MLKILIIVVIISCWLKSYTRRVEHLLNDFYFIFKMHNLHTNPVTHTDPGSCVTHKKQVK